MKFVHVAAQIGANRGVDLPVAKAAPRRGGATPSRLVSAALLSAALVSASTGCGDSFGTGSGDGGATSTATTSTTTDTGSGGSGTTHTGGDGGGGSGGTGGGTATGEPCHPPLLHDDFEAQELDLGLWEPYTNGINVSTSGGRLRFTPNPDAELSWYAEVYSKFTYDLRNCMTWVEAPTVLPPGTPGDTTFEVRLDGNNLADIAVTEGGLAVEFSVGGAIVAEDYIQYDPTNHRWWRFRDEGGTSYLETSPDGISWDERLSMATPFDLSAVTIGLTMGVWGQPTGAAGTGEFDNLNELPAR